MAFHIALNMAGAVSAGAYTAGVLDFLVDALDQWYAAKEQCRKDLGDDTRQWPIPAHDVVLDVMSGASAGGMCAAIGALSLHERFDHVRATGASKPWNRLYQSWVDSIDIMPLLGTEDLPGGLGPVKSLLDSSPIAAIAKSALQPDAAKALPERRKWVAEKLGVILTLTDLRGIPYSVDIANAGSFEERMSYHADRIEFSVAASGARDSAAIYALNYSHPGHPNWETLRKAAMATGAFPVMLASRALDRKRSDYERRLWQIGDSAQEIPPAWDPAVVPPVFPNVYADGGVTNNNPFECARQFLVRAAGNDGRNPRDSQTANAAVISVAPFPGYDTFDPAYDPDKQTSLANVLSALIGAMVNQSRFQGEELVLTKDDQVFSRFAISPSDETAGSDPALMCGSLGAFAGFIDRRFRDHDYQLGRRNCQKFLKDHLTLPESNVTIAQGLGKEPQALERLRRDFGKQVGDTWWYPVIPLMHGVREEVPQLNRADYFTDSRTLSEAAQAATDRVRAVLHAFANSPDSKHAGWSFLISAVFDLGGASRIRESILDILKTRLAHQCRGPAAPA